MSRRVLIRSGLVTIVALVIGGAVAGCGGSEEAGAGNPKSLAVDYERALADAPKPLAELYENGDALLDGGEEAFERQVDRLRGYSVVVNIWASWCGPCTGPVEQGQLVAGVRGLLRLPDPTPGPPGSSVHGGAMGDPP